MNNNEKRLNEIRKELSSYKYSLKTFIIEFGASVALGVLFIVYSAQIVQNFIGVIDPAILTFGVPLIISAPAIILKAIRNNKEIDLQLEYEIIQSKIDRENEKESLKNRINSLTPEQRNKVFNDIELIDLINSSDTNLLKEIAIEMNTEKNMNESMKSSIAPIDRTYEDKLSGNYTKKRTK